ncbi:hypothetical protein M1M34_gp024 [Haloarcula tailed virus 2]|uniref:Uncharacterized protein n=1 Tax=Haloarcula tailed virus 2 TaxID=2877989 RepID=A0AAE8XYW1_9CAUD|nr:hypothetical protein M1M34_gp024 [Haloarcula tailed virus 2]UBF23175.1 hypothetical protein HATV-2_gp24 [Haloarcula tailed virus 2]
MPTFNVTTGTPEGPKTTREVVETVGFVLIGENADGEEQQFEPAITQDVLIENDNETSSVRDQCGRVENRNQGSKGIRYTVEGILTNENVEADDPTVANNLKPSDVIDLQNFTTLRMISDIDSSEIIVKNFSLRQNTDIISIDTGSGSKQAFPFQLQLQRPE